MILVRIVVGRLITRTGRYKGFLLAGTTTTALGYYLLTRLEYGSTQTDLTLAMIITGLGLGAVLQTYTLVVQNATSRGDLGVATSMTQLSRSLGATVGTAIFGTIMVNGMRTEVPKHLPAEAPNGPQVEQFSGASGVGSVLDPSGLAQLPEAVATGIREGLAAAMHPVFVVALPILAVAFVATFFIKELPLRDTAFADEDAGEEMLRSADQSAPEGVHRLDRATNGTVKRKLLLTGISLEYLAYKIENADGECPRLVAAASALAPDEPNAPGSPRERARLYARGVVRPLAVRMMLAARGPGAGLASR
jgi:MFS family permease